MLIFRSVLKHIAVVFPLGLCLMTVAVSAKDAAVDFSLQDMNGKTVRLSDYRGKWVVVNFWATWCPPCLDEIPELVEFHGAHQNKDAVVLGLNYEEVDLAYLKEFAGQSFINYPILLTEPGQKLPFGTLLGLPTTILVSPEGVPVIRRTGAVTQQELEQTILELKQDGK